jgi:hypothetical protein
MQIREGDKEGGSDMRRIFWVLAMVLSLSLLVGCSSSAESAQQKLDDFKKAHGAIYDAWKAETMNDLENRLSAGVTDPLLVEQVQQQSKVMQARLMMNEKHIVKQITYNKLEMLKDGDNDFTVGADWTVDGIIDHGDVHEMKVSYRKKFHAVKKDGTWKLDQMSDWAK